MVDRFLAWLGAGAIVVGLSSGMLAGAGVALAEEGAATDGGATTTSESSNPVENKDDSTAPVDRTDSNKPDDDATTDDTDDVTDEEAADEADEKADEEAEDDFVGESKAKNDSDTAETNRAATRLTRPDAFDDQDSDVDDDALAAKVAKVANDAVDPVTESKPTAAAQRKALAVNTAIDTDTADAPETAAVAFAAAADEKSDATAAAPPLQGLLSVIGTVVFNLYGVAMTILGGPPVLPANSGVTVRTSSLHLDCGCDDGDGVDVQADWYVPDTIGEAPPDRMVVLQHGFLARGPWYSYTAAALAKQTNSIVVAPSITSNFLASDACWLGGTSMHEAMARLFDDDNTALAESAAAADYDGPIPDRVVLMGHSLGGAAVIGIAGAMADNGTLDRLAGVIMLDGVPIDPKAAESVAKVDDDIPMYNLAAPRYFWNQFGVGSDALLAARPGQFIGVTLVGGSHVDPMRGGNPLIQFGQELVAGFVRPENGDAAQMLMIDWANDMFAGVTHDPITDAFTIDTPSGEATAVPLPNDLTKPFILNPVQAFVSLGDGFFTIEPACVQDSVASCSASMAA